MTTAASISEKEKADAIAAEKAAEKEHQDALKRQKELDAKNSAGTDKKAGEADTADLEKSIAKLETDLEESRARLAKAKEGEFQKHDQATVKLGGVTKILREAGDSNTGKPQGGHVVQQGGGGAVVDGASGGPIR